MAAEVEISGQAGLQLMHKGRKDMRFDHLDPS